MSLRKPLAGRNLAQQQKAFVQGSVASRFSSAVIRWSITAVRKEFSHSNMPRRVTNSGNGLQARIQRAACREFEASVKTENRKLSSA